MDKLNSERLNDSYLKYISIKNAIVYIQKQTFTRNDDNFLNAIGFPYIGEKSKNKGEFVRIKIDSMINAIEELIILGLVADFEKIVFERVDNASGEISKIVKQKYTNKPFKDFSSDFVKSSKEIDKLSIIKNMVSTKLPTELNKRFSEIVEYRNRLAHGKRFGNESLLSFDEIAQALDDVLNYI